MVNRINLLLKAKNITARQFAEEIGIQPSGMSHILSGRNNPSLDFVMKVIRRYPEIDINWLMFGKGEMYESPAANRHGGRQATGHPSPLETPGETARVQMDGGTASKRQAAPMPTVYQSDLFSQPDENGLDQSNSTAYPIQTNHVDLATPPAQATAAPAATNAPTDLSQHTAEATHPGASHTVLAPPEHAGVGQAPVERKLVRLLAFYDDHTFVEYRPQ